METNKPGPDEPLAGAWEQCEARSASDFEGGRAALDGDLTPFIPEAGQYRVRFEPIGGKPGIEEARLFQQGQESNPGILRRVEGAAGLFHISRTAVVTAEADIRMSVVLSGEPCSGAVLIGAFSP